MRVCQFRHSRKMRLLGGEKDFGGQGWIRTTEVCDGRFTVCSLWPLGNLPMLTEVVKIHTVTQTVALSFSLSVQTPGEEMELVKGLEPATC